MSAWGSNKPASILTTDTPEQAAARKKAEDSARAAKQLEADANRLIALIYQAIAGQAGGSAPDYPGDKQYSVAGRWATRVVNRAIEIWEGTEGVGYHTMTGVKRTGVGRIGDTQTNFICKIIGPATKDDHDAMKVKADKASAPALGKASDFRAKRDELAEAAEVAPTDRDYYRLKREAGFADKDMRKWEGRADNDRLFAEEKMARHNVHVTHDVARAT